MTWLRPGEAAPEEPFAREILAIVAILGLSGLAVLLLRALG